MSMLHDLVFAWLVDWLTPLEFDGRALSRLPADDPRRRVDRALAAEILTTAALLERLAGHTLVPLKAFLSKSAHRDKLGLFVQRAVLIPIGLLPRGSLTDTLGRLRDAIADSRRANNWLGGVGPLLELRASSALHKEPDRLSWALRVAAEVAGFISISTEHIRWLRHHRIISGPPAPMAKRHNRWMAVRNACLLARLLIKLSRTRAGRKALRRAAMVLGFGAKPPSLQISEAEQAEEVEDALEGPIVLGSEERGLIHASALEAMRLAQAAHLGKLVQTHESLVGLLGIVTAGTELRQQWSTVVAPKAKAA